MKSDLRDKGKASLTASDKNAELQIFEGSIGPDVIALKGLHKATGHFTYDPGFGVTASCESKLTYIDGKEGILAHRGYKIDELAEHADFLEAAQLLLEGELPNEQAKQEFAQNIKSRAEIPVIANQLFTAFDRDAHPMSFLTAFFGNLASFHYDDMDVSDPGWLKEQAMNIIAQMPTIAARILRYGRSEDFIAPEPGLGYAENFLRMCFAKPDAAGVSPLIADALEKIFVLHIDHEQNASTATVRMAASTGCSPYAALAAGCAALWGPAHGGANEACIKMLTEIGSVDNISAFIDRAKDKNDPFRLMGFGHRVYKNFDPRAIVMQKRCREVLKELGMQDDPLLKIATELEDRALDDPYFVERKLYPNVDFYSGIIFKAIGFPSHYFTILFALARSAGWIAQLIELRSDPALRIGRPRQIYTGSGLRPFAPISQR